MPLIHKGDNTKRFSKLSDQLLRTIWEASPVEATLFGIHEYDDTLGDVSADAFQSYASRFRGFVEALESEVDPVRLDPELQTDYHVAVSLASTNYLVLERQKPWANNPAMYASMGMWGCYALLLREFAPLDERLRSMLNRMREIPEMLEQSKSSLSKPARVFAEVGMEVAQGSTAFFRGVLPHIAGQVPSLERDLLSANESVVSAFEGYEEWIREEVLHHTSASFAIGHNAYQQFLFAEHYLTYSPDDLVLLGKSILEQTLDEIRDVAASIDPSVTWQELVSRLKQEHPSKDRLSDAYRTAMESARDFVIEHDIATIPADERLDVCATPEFERSTTPYAAYLPPAPFEPENTGYFWVTPVNMTAPEEHQEAQLLGHCTYTIPIIALHEGYPGHHLQLTRAKSARSALRKKSTSNLLIEGWALYCEDMMRELGFYEDPRVRLFQLKDLLWRAVRVIVDVGLHTKGMTFDDAVHMLVNVARLEEVNAVAEVKRYAIRPTQPMSYVIGKLLITDLRKRMEQKLEERFNLKAFHDRLLDYGSIPPALIASRMVAEPFLEKRTISLRRSA